MYWAFVVDYVGVDFSRDTNSSAVQIYTVRYQGEGSLQAGDLDSIGIEDRACERTTLKNNKIKMLIEDIKGE